MLKFIDFPYNLLIVTRPKQIINMFKVYFCFKKRGGSSMQVNWHTCFDKNMSYTWFHRLRGRDLFGSIWHKFSKYTWLWCMWLWINCYVGLVGWVLVWWFLNSPLSFWWNISHVLSAGILQFSFISLKFFTCIIMLNTYVSIWYLPILLIFLRFVLYLN